MSDLGNDVAQQIVFCAVAGPAAGLVVARTTEQYPKSSVQVLATRPMVIPGATTTRVSGAMNWSLHLENADVVVVLGTAVDDRDPYEDEAGHAVHVTKQILDAAQQAQVGHIIVISSALVLGAMAANPVPLTEAAVVHPESSFRPAVELAEVERLVTEVAASGALCTVLRAAPVVSEGSPGWLANELHRSLAYPIEGFDPGLQYLHARDLGDAISTVIRHPTPGVLHVAPDGALSGGQRRALETRPRLHVPDAVGQRAARIRSTFRGTKGPEGIRPYLLHSWAISNDRLRALGWEPSHGNEEAYVAAFRAAPWSMLGSGKRQELLLGGAGVVSVGAALAAATVLRRRRK